MDFVDFVCEQLDELKEQFWEKGRTQNVCGEGNCNDKEAEKNE